MKFATLFAVVALCAGAAYGRQILVPGVNGTAVAVPNADPKLCPTCVSFMIDGLDILIDAIANGGIIGGCGDLCGKLPNRPEFVVCDALCIYVGIEVLIRALNETDPDPIFICEEIDICPIATNASAHITSASVSPTTGSIGTTFDFSMVVNVTVALGTGVADLSIQPPGKEFPFSFDYLLVAFPPGIYPITFKVQAEDSEQETWPNGQYNATLSVCEGFCDSIHKNQYILDQTSVLFSLQ